MFALKKWLCVKGGLDGRKFWKLRKKFRMNYGVSVRHGDFSLIVVREKYCMFYFGDMSWAPLTRRQQEGFSEIDVLRRCLGLTLELLV